jgi:signal transduction histidine kinase
VKFLRPTLPTFRSGRPSIGELDFRDLVEDALMVLRPELATTRIETLIEEDLRTRGQLEQLILNLVRN